MSDFRQSMRRLAASVNVLTVMEGGRAKGMLATAVCSLSLDPPSLLVCVNKSASLYPAFAETELFGVNILSSGQATIATRFADPKYRETRFDGVEWALHEDAVPLISGAQAALACRRSSIFEYATHSIIVGEYVSGTVQHHGTPLVWVDGGFATVLAEEPAV